MTGYVHDDACNYRIADRQSPDIVLSETMNVCLAKEPLVTIACRLLSQAPTAILLPNRVFIDLCLIDPAKEFVFVDSDHVGELPVPQRDRLFLGSVFELNAQNAISWASLEERIPAARLTVPSLQDSRYRPMLMTTVVVYSDTILKDYDSSLTCPQPFSAGKPPRGGDVLDFHYRLGTEPRLVW